MKSYFLKFNSMSFRCNLNSESIFFFDFSKVKAPNDLIIEVDAQGNFSRQNIEGQEELPLLEKVITQVSEYFNGERTTFDLPFRFEGTDFQKQVWNHLRTIPYGTTKSYSAFAEEIKRPKAVRAVGGAIGKNPFGLLIPCHRVIGKNGTLTGFAGGLPTKKILLDHESKFKSV